MSSNPGSLTQANYLANIKTARGNVAAQMGLAANFNYADLSYDQKTAFNLALAREILKYPNSFSSDETDIARRIVTQPAYSALLNTDLDLGQFVDQTLQNANNLNPLNPSGPIGRWVVGIGLTILALWLMFHIAKAEHVLKGE